MLISIISAPESCGQARRFRHDIRVAAGDLHHVEPGARALCFQPVGGIAAGVKIRRRPSRVTVREAPKRLPADACRDR